MSAVLKVADVMERTYTTHGGRVRAIRTFDEYARIGGLVPRCSLLVSVGEDAGALPCVYVLIDEGRVGYVGKAQRGLATRLRAHRASKRYQSVIVIAVGVRHVESAQDISDILYGLEGVVAGAFDPPQNVKRYQIPQPIWSAWSRRLGFIRQSIEGSL